MIAGTTSSKKIVIISMIILSLTSTLALASAQSCGKKRGFLLVSDDGVHFEEVTEDFRIRPGKKYWIKIGFEIKPWDLGDSMPIRVVKETDCTNENGWTEVNIVEKSTEPFEWSVPQDIKFSTKYIVQFKKPLPDYYVPTIVYVTMGKFRHTGRFSIIPEFIFGTITAIISAISGLILYRKYKF